MGNTSSTNDIYSAINVAISVFNTQAQNCSSGSHQTVNVNIGSCGKIDIKDFDINQIQTIATTCIQKGNINNTQKSKISQVFTQLAKSISQNLDLNPGSTSASNVVSACVDLSENIVNAIQQNCNMSNDQVINWTVNNQNQPDKCLWDSSSFKNRSYPGINIVGVALNQSQKAQLNCLLQSDITNSQISQLQQEIQQKATAVVQDAIFWILMAVAAIVASLGLIAKGNGPIAWVLAFALLIGGFFLVAWLGHYFGWFSIFPFKKKQEKDGRASPPSLPPNIVGESAANMLAVPYRYLTRCDTSWVTIRPLMFPDIPKTMSDDEAAQLVLKTNNTFLPNGVSNNPNIPASGKCAMTCSCACTTCKQQKSIDQCDAECLYGICPGNDDSLYNTNTCVKLNSKNEKF